jgi:dienelactone hydrolase
MAIILAIAVGGGVWAVRGPYGRAAALLVYLTDARGWPASIARLHDREFVERDFEIAGRHRTVRARAYHPAQGTWRPILVLSGVRPEGIDEPRLIDFARSLARIGFGAITPDLPGLFDFEIGPDSTDLIEDVTAWALAQGDLGANDRVGLIGISFSGGLAIAAAGRESIRDRVAFVMTVGSHGDLLRTLDTLAGGILSDSAAIQAHPDGLAIVLASVAPRVVPADQVPAVRAWARTFLTATHLPLDDPQRPATFAEADRLVAALPEPSATFAAQARDADFTALRPYLLPHVRELGGDPALSPERSPAPRAPVYLLHGTDDPVIPAEESERLAAYLRPRTRVRLLVTPVLSHADLGAGGGRDVLDLVTFVGSMLRQ